MGASEGISVAFTVKPKVGLLKISFSKKVSMQ
jgi:hypothetical protein